MNNFIYSKKYKIYHDALRDYYQSKHIVDSKNNRPGVRNLDTTSFTKTSSPSVLNRQDSKTYPDLEIKLQQADYFPAKKRHYQQERSKLMTRIKRLQTDFELGYESDKTLLQRLEHRLRLLEQGYSKCVNNHTTQHASSPKSKQQSISQDEKYQIYRNLILEKSGRNPEKIKSYLHMSTPSNNDESKYIREIESVKKGRDTYYYYLKLPKNVLEDYVITTIGTVNYGPPKKVKKTTKKTATRTSKDSKPVKIPAKKKTIRKRSSLQSGGKTTQKNITWNDFDSDGNKIIDNSKEDLLQTKDFSSIDLDSLETIQLDDDEERYGDDGDNHNNDDIINSSITTDSDINTDITTDSDINSDINTDITTDITTDNKIADTDTLDTNLDYLSGGGDLDTVDDTSDIEISNAFDRSRSPSESSIDRSSLTPDTIPSMSPSSLSPGLTPSSRSPSPLLLPSSSISSDSENNAQENIKTVTISPSAFDATEVAGSMTQKQLMDTNEETPQHLFNSLDTTISPPSPPLQPILNSSSPKADSIPEITISTEPQT